MISTKSPLGRQPQAPGAQTELCAYHAHPYCPLTACRSTGQVRSSGCPTGPTDRSTSHHELSSGWSAAIGTSSAHLCVAVSLGVVLRYSEGCMRVSMWSDMPIAGGGDGCRAATYRLGHCLVSSMSKSWRRMVSYSQVLQLSCHGWLTEGNGGVRGEVGRSSDGRRTEVKRGRRMQQEAIVETRRGATMYVIPCA